jgi:hypothetical protein
MNKDQNQGDVTNVAVPITDDQLEMWREIKDRIWRMMPSTEGETLVYVQKTLNLVELNLKLSTAEMYATTTVRDFFLNDFYHNTAKNLISCRSFSRSDMLAYSNRILECLLLYFAKTINDDNFKMCETFRLILDYARQYYKCNDQDEESVAPVQVTAFPSISRLIYILL